MYILYFISNFTFMDMDPSSHSQKEPTHTHMKACHWIRLPYLSKKIFVFELQWIFDAPERNKDASQAPTARELTLDVLHTIRAAAFVVRVSPNRLLKAKRREGRKEREKRKRRKGRERRKGGEAPANSPLDGPSAAHEYKLAHLLSAA
jgi:hypothetical protein